MSTTKKENQLPTIEEIAKTCHEVNRAYCEGMGDYSQLYWDIAPDWQRESAIKGVEAVRDDGPDDPERTHNNWLAYKVNHGWKYGPEKDPAKKEHPCIVPYSELTQGQKAKDELFCIVASALLASQGDASQDG